MRAVIAEKLLKALVDVRTLRGAEGTLHEQTRAVTDVPGNNIERERRETKALQNVIHRGGKIGTRVDQCSVEVEDKK